MAEQLVGMGGIRRVGGDLNPDTGTYRKFLGLRRIYRIGV